MSLTKYPSSDEGWLTTSEGFDAALHAASVELAAGLLDSLGPDYPKDASLEERSHDLFSDRLLEVARSVIFCENCGRIWLQRRPGSTDYLCYRRDDDLQTDQSACC